MTDLRNYISLIKKSGDLKTIKSPVSTRYEIAGITAKVDGSFAVLFENIKGSNFNLIANLVGTRRRFSQAVGSSETKIHEKVISAIKIYNSLINDNYNLQCNRSKIKSSRGLK